MKHRNVGRNLSPRRARRRPVNHRRATVAAFVDRYASCRFEFDRFDYIPAIVHRDERGWTFIDMRFLRYFGAPLADRLTAVTADGRTCVSVYPWFDHNAHAARIEVNGYETAVAWCEYQGALIAETRIPRFCSPLGDRFGYVLDWLDRITRATIDGRIS
jgi:hypothetical protein